VIDITTNSVVGDPIGVANGPFGIAMSRDGARAYVTNLTGNSVSVIDIATNSVIGDPIAVGFSPYDIAIPLTGPDITEIANDPSSQLTVFAGTAGAGIYITTNGGMSWTASNSGLTDFDITALAIASDGSAVYAGTRAGGVFKSTDGGASWQAMNNGLDLRIRSLSILAGNDQTLFAGIADGGGVYRSIDGGANWEAANVGLP
jgi:YVTN family beta-propeller protein